MRLVPGTTVGDFELLERVGQGPQSEVWRAVATERVRGLDDTLVHQREVALKLVLAVDGSASDEIAREWLHTRRAEHPNVVRALSAGRFEPYMWLAMELVQGRTLTELLDCIDELGARLPDSVVGDLAEGICKGLHAAHTAPGGRGIIHRDVKSSNVILDRFGVVKVLDFGIARGDLQSQHTLGGQVRGTLLYMAPEQHLGSEGLSPATDLFALGAVLFELLTSEPLYAIPSNWTFPDVMALRERKTSGAYLAERLAAHRDRLGVFEPLLVRLLQGEPTARPRSAEEVVRLLRGLGIARRHGYDTRLLHRALSGESIGDPAAAPDADWRRLLRRALGTAGELPPVPAVPEGLRPFFAELELDRATEMVPVVPASDARTLIPRPPTTDPEATLTTPGAHTLVQERTPVPPPPALPPLAPSTTQAAPAPRSRPWPWPWLGAGLGVLIATAGVAAWLAGPSEGPAAATPPSVTPVAVRAEPTPTPTPRASTAEVSPSPAPPEPAGELAEVVQEEGASEAEPAGALRCFADADGDGHGDRRSPASCSVGVRSSDDCNDGDRTIRPGVQEAPCDGVDQDCDGRERCFVDADGDGYPGGDEQESTSLSCDEPSLSCATRDCDDEGRDDVHPGAEEDCTTARVDEDCDGDPLSGCAPVYGARVRHRPAPGSSTARLQAEVLGATCTFSRLTYTFDGDTRRGKALSAGARLDVEWRTLVDRPRQLGKVDLRYQLEYCCEDSCLETQQYTLSGRIE